jgi:NADPH-dependent glutamate synthase beta subunit-like oxidoreductase
VALDVARMLALTEEELAPTDTTDEAMAAIAGSGIREIVVLGRRGPVQAAWTPPELAELGEMAGADVVVDPAELELDEISAAELEAGDHIRKRNMEVLSEFAEREPSGKPRRIVLRFRVSPVAVLGSDRVEAVEVVRNELVPDGRGSVRAQPTGDREVIECGLLFRSVGYRGLPMAEVPFDEGTNTMPNSQGRVLDAAGDAIPGVYCAGWIKRGPTGVVGTNKHDARETVAALLSDATDGTLATGGPIGDLVAELVARGAEPVLIDDWRAIDAAEVALGATHGRARTTLHEREALLAAVRAATGA